MKKELLDEYIIAPNPDGVELTKTVEGLDHQGNSVISQVNRGNASYDLFK